MGPYRNPRRTCSNVHCTLAICTIKDLSETHVAAVFIPCRAEPLTSKDGETRNLLDGKMHYCIMPKS